MGEKCLENSFIINVKGKNVPRSQQDLAAMPMMSVRENLLIRVIRSAAIPGYIQVVKLIQHKSSNRGRPGTAN